MKGKVMATNYARHPAKDEMNKCLAQEGNRAGKALILDTGSLKTFKALINAKWKHGFIWSVNYSDEECKKMARNGMRDCRIINDTFNNAIRRFGIETFGAIYYDSMDTVNGNKKYGTRPLDDIAEIICGKYLMVGGTLGITVALRGKDQDTPFTNRHLLKIIATVITLAIETDTKYHLYTRPGGHYKNGGSMGAVMFRRIR